MNIVFEPRLFLDYCAPLGKLDTEPATHGCFYYNLLARKMYEDTVIDPIVIEGEKDPTTNYRQLFESIARLYGVEPDEMAKAWFLVEQQCVLIGIPTVPRQERYRFDNPVIVVV